MHVVMLTNAVAPDKLGGLERYVRELSAGLVVAGHEVTVVAKRISPDDPEHEVAADGVRVVRHDVPSKRDPTFAVRYPFLVSRAVDRALRTVDLADTVLHAHFPVPALVPALRRMPYVYTLHAPVHRELLVERQGSYLLPGPVQRPARALLRGAEAVVVRRARRVVTLSDFMRGEVADLDAGAGARTTVLAGGVDTGRFTPGAGPSGTTDGPVLFTARRLVPRTGVQQLVQAMPAVLAAHPGARLLVAGDGPQRAPIEAEIARLGLADRVTLLGRISDDELVRRYREADLVVTPTQELEGFGLASAEALACGTPCLVTPAGANPEVVTPLSPTLVAADVTPAAMAASVVALLGPDGGLADLRARARAVVHPSMGWRSIVERHLELYAGLGSRPELLAGAVSPSGSGRAG